MYVYSKAVHILYNYWLCLDAAQYTSLSSITKNIFKSQGARGFFVGKLVTFTFN